MTTIFVTREIPEAGILRLQQAGHTVIVSEKDGVLTHDELVASLRVHKPDALLSLLTDTIDEAVFTAAPQIKIVANYAVGYNNIDLVSASSHEIVVTNTPGVLTHTVAEHTIALMLAITSRIAEGDRMVRAGKYYGWAPMLLLGTDLKGKTLGIVGSGSIGSRVAEIAHKGLGMQIIYHDIHRNDILERELQAIYKDTPEALCKDADVVSVHLPLRTTTHHFINSKRLSLMKTSAYLVNTSRGAVIDEEALTHALQDARIRGAALDVYEHEPLLTSGLQMLDNVVLTPHIASATEETRTKMSVMVAENIIDFFNHKTPAHVVTAQA